MAETHVLSALKRRYAHVLGADPASPDLVPLAAVIRMFNPAEDLAAIRAVRRYKANRERWNLTALRILRGANRPLKTRELARMVMQAHGVPLDDERALLSLTAGLQAVLARLAVRELVEISGKPRRWSVSPPRAGRLRAPAANP